MTLKSLGWRLPVAMALVAGAQHAAAEFVVLPGIGPAVLTPCNPMNSSTEVACQVASLPGESGYDQTASRSAPLIVNDVTVGTVYEKVWRNSADQTLYIVGTQVVLNSNAFDDSGLPFQVNDVFRRSLPGRKVSVAYFLDDAPTALKYAGRTVQGLDEYDGRQPERDRTWADFRIDSNGGAANPKSPWLLIKSRAPKGLAIDPFGIRALSSGGQTPIEVLTTGYQPNGLPQGGDDDGD